MKNILVTLMALTLTIAASAQDTKGGKEHQANKTVHLWGSVEDGFLKTPLPKAKVSILRADSSLVVDSAQIICFFNGERRIVRAQFGAEVSAAGRTYLVRSRLDGYDDVWQRIDIGDPKQEDVEVPTLKMRRMTSRNLREVTVTATKIKMFYRGDTLVYDATAFQMPEGSMLDDLIRQLPGVTMNADGEIFVNGRKVDELLPEITWDNSPQQVILKPRQKPK